MDQDGTWHGGRPWSSPHCARWRHSSSPQKGGRAPIFRPIFIVAKRLHGSRFKIPLGTEVSLGLRNIVFDVDPAMAHPPLPILAHVYCGHGRPSQLLLSSCNNRLPVLSITQFSSSQWLSAVHFAVCGDVSPICGSRPTDQLYILC